MGQPDSPLWSILIATLAHREDRFLRLLDSLLRQVQEIQAPVEVVALRNYGSESVSEYRQALLDDARGQFVSFIDDDDGVSPDFVVTILAALDSGADVVGFEVACSGLPVQKTMLSVKHWGAPWDAVMHEGQPTLLRYTTHLCPVRAELARKAGFAGKLDYGEDRAYSLGLHPLLEDATEVYIPRSLYHYIWNPGDTSRQFEVPDLAAPWVVAARRRDHRPIPGIWHPNFRWHERSTP